MEKKQRVWTPEMRKAASERAKERERDPEVRRKRSESLKKTYSNPEVREGCAARARAQHQDDESKERHRAACAEAQNRPETKQKKSDSLRKVMKTLRNEPESRIANSLRNGGDGDLQRIDKRKSDTLKWKSGPDYLWQRAVKERDNFTCQNCNTTDQLHAHHVNPQAAFPGLALDIDNGITLCKECHVREHRRMKAEVKHGN
jgi:5-methylcytosine-specific restriction endonuclease McrA